MHLLVALHHLKYDNVYWKIVILLCKLNSIELDHSKLLKKMHNNMKSIMLFILQHNKYAWVIVQALPLRTLRWLLESGIDLF